MYCHGLIIEQKSCFHTISNPKLVPETGLEPARTKHMLLRHTCIPISPLGPVFIITQSYDF